MVWFDEDTFELVLDDDSARIAVPEPSGGCGGHEVVVSPGRRFAAVFLHTGESEEGYELFELRPKLRHIGGLPQVFGEGHPPVFSPDERWIALGVAVDPGLARAKDGRVHWADLHVQDLKTLAITRCRVDVQLDGDCEEEIAHVENLRFTSEGLRFGTPWGAVATVAVPPPESVVVVLSSGSSAGTCGSRT